MEKLAQASAQQQSLNGQCKNLMGMKPGASQKPLSISFGDARAQQSAIRGELESLQEQMGPNGEKPLGDLGQTAAQMEEVERDLENQTFTERTLKLQERILSRLLDAQRSIRRQDESKKRESRSARPLQAEQGESLERDQRQEELRRDLLRALSGDYSPQSEELIRRYFRALDEREQDSLPEGQQAPFN